MNTKTILIVLLVLSGLQIKAQMINSTVVDPKTKTKMLIGYCDKKGLEKMLTVFILKVSTMFISQMQHTLKNLMASSTILK